MEQMKPDGPKDNFFIKTRNCSEKQKCFLSLNLSHLNLMNLTYCLSLVVQAMQVPDLGQLWQLPLVQRHTPKLAAFPPTSTICPGDHQTKLPYAGRRGLCVGTHLVHDNHTFAPAGTNSSTLLMLSPSPDRCEMPWFSCKLSLACRQCRDDVGM